MDPFFIIAYMSKASSKVTHYDVSANLAGLVFLKETMTPLIVDHCEIFEFSSVKIVAGNCKFLCGF